MYLSYKVGSIHEELPSYWFLNRANRFCSQRIGLLLLRVASNALTHEIWVQ